MNKDLDVAFFAFLKSQSHWTAGKLLQEALRAKKAGIDMDEFDGCICVVMSWLLKGKP